MMKPRGPLMIEHRVVEKMIGLMNREIGQIQANGKIRSDFITAAVDFLRTYADRTHHGKEEDILFQVLEKKDLSEKDQNDMNDLIAEHKRARQTVSELVKAEEEYRRGNEKSLKTVLEKMQMLVNFYPLHIRKEDEEFFPNTEKYFSEQEQQKMLEAFWEFDRQMIHEKYRKVVDDWR